MTSLLQPGRVGTTVTGTGGTVIGIAIGVIIVIGLLIVFRNLWKRNNSK